MATGGYRYVIVGAGPSGCVVANRLSADPACRVALLEAGGPDRVREIRIPAAFTKLLQTGYDCQPCALAEPPSPWSGATSRQLGVSRKAGSALVGYSVGPAGGISVFV